MLKKLLPAYSRGMKLIQRHYYLLLLIFVINSTYVMAQLPSNEEVMALAITQKKATDSKDALPFTPAPGRRVKYMPAILPLCTIPSALPFAAFYRVEILFRQYCCCLKPKKVTGEMVAGITRIFIGLM